MPCGLLLLHLQGKREANTRHRFIKINISRVVQHSNSFYICHALSFFNWRRPPSGLKLLLKLAALAETNFTDSKTEYQSTFTLRSIEAHFMQHYLIHLNSSISFRDQFINGDKIPKAFAKGNVFFYFFMLQQKF